MVSGLTVFAAQYIHNLDPIAFSVFGLSIRWYGIAYVLGFIAGYIILQQLAQRGRSVLKPTETSDFITYSALFGVMLGGRLGYMLLYDLDHFLSNPLILFHLRSGGMASHGAIAGLMIFTGVYAWRKNLNWPGLGDSLVVVAPLGIAFGRIANFINGELWGKQCPPDYKWGVRFPTELTESDLPASFKVTLPQEADTMDKILELAREDPALLQQLGEMVQPRYPSQLFQAGMEGFLLFGILIATRLIFKKLPFGLLTSLFFLLYAGFRIYGEVYREPDRNYDGSLRNEFVLGLSAGQFYSLFMVVAGLGFLWYACTRGRKAAAAAQSLEEKTITP
ncbi:MAG: phosphatidylglycerol:prolipoprotein diacylglycerol transferase [Verrucomicrobiales bacterium]|jgi:phosphatidylglycerol:prolipoprotein diacylglycerol transferase